MKNLAYTLFAFGVIQCFLFSGMLFKTGERENKLYSGGVFFVALAAFILAQQKK